LKKYRTLGLIVLVIIFFIPFIRISNAQGIYVGIQSSAEYEWGLSVYTGNLNTYTTDDLGSTIENLIPLGSDNLSRVLSDWSPLTPPQSYWPLTVINIGAEETGSLFSPDDNTTITFTPVNGTLGWFIPLSDSDEWDDTWYIVNDTSNFLRQTLNLSRVFSPYAMFKVLFAPANINWPSLINDFLSVMNSRGNLYKNISATLISEGFFLHVPPLGFENNSVAIDIKITYNSDGVLSHYEFLYGGQTLVKFILGRYIPEQEKVPVEYIYVFIGLTTILIVEILFYSLLRKGRK